MYITTNVLSTTHNVTTLLSRDNVSIKRQKYAHFQRFRHAIFANSATFSQRSAARYILRNYERKPGTVTQLSDQLEFESLADRRKKQLRLNLLFTTVNNLVDIPHDHLLTTAQQRTRGSRSLKSMAFSTQTDVLKYSFPRTVID